MSTPAHSETRIPVPKIKARKGIDLEHDIAVKIRLAIVLVSRDRQVLVKERRALSDRLTVVGELRWPCLFLLCSSLSR